MVKFDRFIFADWSSSKGSNMGENSIWIGSCSRGAMKTVEVVNPPTRKEALSHLQKIITDNRNAKTLVGFDFGFGYPHEVYDKNTIGKDWEALWKRLHKEILCKECGNEKRNRFKLAQEWNKEHRLCFWGEPNTKKGEQPIGLKKDKVRKIMDGMGELRITEKCIKRSDVKSQWQLYGKGSVGSQTLLGIPYAYELREYLNGNNIDTKVWPFETDFTKKFKGQVLICEVHFGAIPEVMLCVDKKVKLFKKNESHRLKNDYPKDRMQVEKMCQFFAKKNESDIKQLLEFKWDRFEKNEKDKITKKEGWILGVPLCSPLIEPEERIKQHSVRRFSNQFLTR